MAEKDYDNRMHTAEHILNSVMNRMFSCGRSFRSHIEKKKSKCDYHFNRPMTPSEIETVEAAVNEIISMNIALTEEFVTKDVAESNYFTGKLPQDSGDNIRIVRIGSYDACPCIGPHVRSTGEVGRFYFTTVDYDQNILRMRFKLDQT
jgi:misacylated tRNA(Ala) deacylase